MSERVPNADRETRADWEPRSPHEQEESLTDRQQGMLQQGLRQVPLPRVQPDFNAVALARIKSGQDFDSAGKQFEKRLRWAALPALFGFATMMGLATINAHWFEPKQEAYPRLNYVQPAPPLPPMPALSRETSQHQPGRAERLSQQALKEKILREDGLLGDPGTGSIRKAAAGSAGEAHAKAAGKGAGHDQ